MKFPMVRITEDGFDGRVVQRSDELGAGAESVPQHWVVEIGHGFVERANRVFLRGRTLAESFDLWKDEPHPMAFLAAHEQFALSLVVDASLGVEEALEMVGIAIHCRSTCDLSAVTLAFDFHFVSSQDFCDKSFRWVVKYWSRQGMRLNHVDVSVTGRRLCTGLCTGIGDRLSAI